MQDELESPGTDSELFDPEDLSEPAVSASGPDAPEAESASDIDLELQKTEDLLLRKQAEFENYRKRVVKEKAQLRLDSQSELIEALLPVLDAGQKALGGLEESDLGTDLEVYQHGFELLLAEMRAVFNRFGVEPIPAVGERFDPNLHEAIGRVETDQKEDGTILEEVRVGYTIRGRLLRASQVMVGVARD